MTCIIADGAIVVGEANTIRPRYSVQYSITTCLIILGDSDQGAVRMNYQGNRTLSATIVAEKSAERKIIH